MEMLYDQLPGKERGERALEWKLNVPSVLSVSAKRQTRASDVGTQDMLTAIVDELQAEGKVGTIEQPNLYIKQTMSMRWGMYHDAGEKPEDEAPLVYFGGFDPEARIHVGLGGSSKHVVGCEGATSTYSRSVTPALVRALLKGLENRNILMLRDERAEHRDVLSAIVIANYYLRPPVQQLEFLAKVLDKGEIDQLSLFTQGGQARVILGTPLYVALSAPDPNDLGWSAVGFGTEDTEG